MIRCTDHTKPQFARPNSKYQWFQIDFSSLHATPIFEGIRIIQSNKEYCCNVPDIFIEFSNDTSEVKNWKTFTAPLNKGETVIDLTSLKPIYPPISLFNHDMCRYVFIVGCVETCPRDGVWPETLPGYVAFPNNCPWYQT